MLADIGWRVSSRGSARAYATLVPQVSLWRPAALDTGHAFSAFGDLQTAQQHQGLRKIPKALGTANDKGTP
jgi:hypothetical protein